MRRRIWIAAILVGLAALPTYAQTSPSPQGRIVGTVVNDEGDPIRGHALHAHHPPELDRPTPVASGGGMTRHPEWVLRVSGCELVANKAKYEQVVRFSAHVCLAITASLKVVGGLVHSYPCPRNVK